MSKTSNSFKSPEDAYSAGWAIPVYTISNDRKFRHRNEEYTLPQDVKTEQVEWSEFSASGPAEFGAIRVEEAKSIAIKINSL